MPADPVVSPADTPAVLRAYAEQLPTVLSVPNLRAKLREAADEIDALLAVGERDRRQIARLRRIVHSFPPLPEMSSDAETAMYVRALKAIRRAVLAVEEDADNG